MILIALGGNALDVNEKVYSDQRAELTVAQKSMENIVDLIEEGHKDIIISHGNGPQVGKIFLQQELTKEQYKRQAPLDYCVADTQGRLGHFLAESLKNECLKRGINISTTAIITHVEVDPNDKAFTHPTKPIGQHYSKEEADKLAAEKKWIMKEEINKGFRRVVPSPTPKNILEIDIIKTLAANNTVVIAGGGGGIPVINKNGQYEGIEAVIDKDKTSTVMALKSHVEKLIILTEAKHVYINYGKPDQKELSEISVNALETYQAAGHFPAGSMGPKVEAVIEFLRNGGKEAYIGNLFELKNIINGNSGTKITL